MYAVTSDNNLILDSLDVIREKWVCDLDPIFVNSVIEVSKSSLTFWNDHIDFVYNGGVTTRKDTCKTDVAVADIRAITGAGAIVGAMFGAIGGTLGEGIEKAGKGGC